MRGYTPGGRFDADYEFDAIQDGIDWDLKNPVGTHALWWVYDSVNSTVDPIYDTGSASAGLVWKGPYKLPVVRAVISQGQVPQDERGFYNTDTLHLTLNSRDIEKIDSNVLNNPDIQNRGRILWKGEIFRPYGVQQRGIIGERFALVVVDCVQLAPEEMVNSTQFLDYASNVPDNWEAPANTYPPYPSPTIMLPPPSETVIDGGTP